MKKNENNIKRKKLSDFNSVAEVVDKFCFDSAFPSKTCSWSSAKTFLQPLWDYFAKEPFSLSAFILFYLSTAQIDLAKDLPA